MCDVCSTDAKWATPPSTPERHAEVHAALEDRIMEDGHQILSIYGDGAGFSYTVGRYMAGKPELLFVGNVSQQTAGSVINSLCKLEDEGEIDLRALATDTPVRINDEWSELRFVRADPDASDMNFAVALGGEDVEAIQVIWPDPHGQWPDNPSGWHYGDGFAQQPIFARGSGD